MNRSVSRYWTLLLSSNVLFYCCFTLLATRDDRRIVCVQVRNLRSASSDDEISLYMHLYSHKLQLSEFPDNTV